MSEGGASTCLCIAVTNMQSVAPYICGVNRNTTPFSSWLDLARLEATAALAG